MQTSTTNLAGGGGRSPTKRQPAIASYPNASTSTSAGSGGDAGAGGGGGSYPLLEIAGVPSNAPESDDEWGLEEYTIHYRPTTVTITKPTAGGSFARCSSLSGNQPPLATKPAAGGSFARASLFEHTRLALGTEPRRARGCQSRAGLDNAGASQGSMMQEPCRGQGRQILARLEVGSHAFAPLEALACV
jgi:hypothetical protein